MYTISHNVDLTRNCVIRKTRHTY